MTSAVVSCIIPVFNGERYIQQALDSIFGQSHQALQVIVVDDGSTDSTEHVVGSYGQRLTYVRQPNAGPATARNNGLQAARGSYIAFLDADDLWSPDKLKLQLARFELKPELDACVAHIQNFWMPELAAEARRLEDHRRGQPIPGYCCSTLLARASLFEEVGPFDEELGHADDTDWFVRVSEAGRLIELLPEVLVRRRMHQASHSRALKQEPRRISAPGKKAP